MKVLLFCAKGFETMEFSVFVDVMGWARNDYDYDVTVESCGAAPTVVSSFGVPVVMDHTIDQISADAFDALAIPGGFEEYGFYEEAYDPRLSALIRDFDRQGKPVAAICVGALALGKSGILRGRRATTYHLRDAYRQKELAAFGVNVVNERIVIDGNIITSYCPETAPDVAFELLRLLLGDVKTQIVRAAMGFAPQFLLQTRRLTLIPLTARQLSLWCDDISALEAELDCSYQATPMTGFFQEIVRAQLIATQADSGNYCWHSFWLLLRKSDRVVVGSADFKDVPGADGAVEIGYGLGAAFEGHGYMTEAVRAMTAWALAQEHVRHVTAETDLDGFASQRILTHCGFAEQSRNDTVWWKL